MSFQVDNAFIEMWTAEAQHELQRMQSFTRNSVRTVNNVNASVYHFPVIGTGNATVNKGRHTDLEPMNVNHTEATATLKNVHAAEWIDTLDQLKTNLDLRSDYTKSIVGALSRQMDRIVIDDALATATTTATLPTANTLNKDGLIHLDKQLSGNLVPRDGNRFLLIGESALEDLLQDTTLTSRDYVAEQGLQKGFVTNVMGFNIIVTDNSNLPVDTAGKHTVFAYWRNSVGHAMGLDMTLRADFLAIKDAFQIMGKFSSGAVKILDGAIIKAEIDD